MVRLRIHTEEDCQQMSNLHIKTKPKITSQFGFDISQTRHDQCSPRKQRALKNIINNAVSLKSTNAFEAVTPSKFSRSRSDLKSSRITPTSTPVATERVSRRSPREETVVKTTRRRPRHVVDSESDSESDEDIPDIFAAQSQIKAKEKTKKSSHDNASKQCETISKDVVSVLHAQGFEFAIEPSIEPVVTTTNLCSSRPTTASGLDTGALLSFEPVKSRSPVRLPPERPSTPTEQISPTKVTLRSPTKKFRLPESPHKSSNDEFWCPSAVNEWIDQHSPQKPIKSPSKIRSDAIPFSPAKAACVSPMKAERQAKKDFNARKHKFASDFLAELDRDITNGKISDLARSAGGVQLVWSNKLNSTAGRAYWRKQEIRTKHSDGTTSTDIKHTASIELAEKVLDEEIRLINTIAHEFCHLATFMIDGVKTNPHGKEFKAWAQKCTIKYAERGVKVTTKHSYEIDYKYVWECSSCGTEYKRHSKSVDVAKHRCGACKSALVQIKPVPRKNTVSEYQMFIKENFQRVKSLDRSASHAVIMETLGRLYRESKSKIEKSIDAVGVDDLVEGIQAVELTD